MHVTSSFSFQPKKVNVTVFYEVLCPDSRHFILRQLFPTWKKVPELMEIDYRPFGKATVSIIAINYPLKFLLIMKFYKVLYALKFSYFVIYYV